MKMYLHPYILLFCFTLYSCSNIESSEQSRSEDKPSIANDKLSGKWYYAEAPQSYIEFSGNTCTEHMGELSASITYAVTWIDSIHYQLEVKQATGPAAMIFKPGDLLHVEIKELTPDYYRFFIKSKLVEQCIVVLRKADYGGDTGKPC
ncbi:MAG: hypothetical protein KIT80_09145 [Chitinophagaceae bacterium]|nr:hypothetical protein [Chitinophagaceae bacterium]MCW5927063.1 hypothetical protein [Chitinophagaceae bacterium]